MRNASIFLLLSLLMLNAWGQNGFIRGTVLDAATGDPLVGVTIMIESLAIGTGSDLEGKFSLSAPAGVHTIKMSYIGYKTLTITEIKVDAGQANVLENLVMQDEAAELGVVEITATVSRTSEMAITTMKRNAPAMIDGISSAKIRLIGDATAVEAAKRVTGVSIEGGKYVYVRGLGDRYAKTTLNGVDIPGLDPDRNSLQMDIFPTNLINNIVVSKNFTADMPADFTGGLLNVETKDFPDEKISTVSFSTAFNPQVHLNADYLTYEGSGTDFLGFDGGARELSQTARDGNIPTPVNGASSAEVAAFNSSFNPELAAIRRRSLLDLSAGISLGNQYALKGSETRTLGYVFSLSYKADYKFYDDVNYSEYQVYPDRSLYDMRYATIQTGEFGESNVLVGALGGLAYKSKHAKIRLTAMHLQNGESRAGKFSIINDGEAVGQSGYKATSDNLEYNQRSLTNVMLNGLHVYDEQGWEIDWRISPTLSLSTDPDIRKTAFTETNNNNLWFSPGAGGNPSRIWRELTEVNIVGKVDLTKKHEVFAKGAKLKFGLVETYKRRDYQILFFDLQTFGSPVYWDSADAAVVLNTENLYPTGKFYYQSGNNTPNPNEYQSAVSNTGAYVSEEFNPTTKLKAVLGLRLENYVQWHTGRDQRYAQGDTTGRNLVNEKVLNSLDLFPSANLIYALTTEQNLRFGYSRTIARPSFKELSFAQIIDPITNRIFNGSLFPYSDWDGELVETRINNLDLRWEMFLEKGQLFSISAFYKQFDNPIELVRIPEQQTSTEFQPRNVGNGSLFGAEVEFRKDLGFIAPVLANFNLNGNFTYVQSVIEMTQTEFQSRQEFVRDGQTIENTRQMAGQSPYVINAGLTYSHEDLGIDAGFFYNVKGKSLYIVGAGLFPDIYLMPFHSLNFSFSKKVGKSHNTSIDFKVANLLNDRIESYYQSYKSEDEVFSSINPNRTFSLGVNHKF